MILSIIVLVFCFIMVLLMCRCMMKLDEIEKQMAGEAAYDYKLLAELDEKKNALEERLLEIYEEI